MATVWCWRWQPHDSPAQPTIYTREHQSHSPNLDMQRPSAHTSCHSAYAFTLLASPAVVVVEGLSRSHVNNWRTQRCADRCCFLMRNRVYMWKIVRFWSYEQDILNFSLLPLLPVHRNAQAAQHIVHRKGQISEIIHAKKVGITWWFLTPHSASH